MTKRPFAGDPRDPAVHHPPRPFMAPGLVGRLTIQSVAGSLIELRADTGETLDFDVDAEAYVSP